VPFGFICGYPVGGVSSELYGYYEGQGGKSGRQGQAVIDAMKRWGESSEVGGSKATELGFAVCKRGYKPFDENGERMYGCGKHSELRLESMRQKPPKGSSVGCLTAEGLYARPGWQAFDQWTYGEKNAVASSSEDASSSGAAAREEAEDDREGAGTGTGELERHAKARRRDARTNESERSCFRSVCSERKQNGGRRETTGKVLKDRRSPRERGRMGTSRLSPNERNGTEPNGTERNTPRART
jgi:hypothetical protein